MENMSARNVPDIFDGVVHEDLDFKYLGGDEFSWKVTSWQDNVPIISRNLAEKVHSDGFFKKRNGKKIASIPSLAYLEAERQGWDLNNRRELFRFLDLHPEFATSDYRPKESRKGIIIK
jgi:hypothetical protein